tara:strand:- start:60 stop:2615 length:2556 start_codon:yes stop_codon:yes gene_type:complete
MPDNQENNNISEMQVDLSNCDREPIHILGRVQSFGALLSVSRDWIVNHASENIDEFIGAKVQDLIGRPLVQCISEAAIHTIRGRLQMLSTADSVERVFGVTLHDDISLFDLAIHYSGRSIIIEIEHHEVRDKTDYASYVRSLIDRIGRVDSVSRVCELGARQMRMLVGFDRAMVYKFDTDGTGIVIAESASPDLESYLGLRYPASDIPRQARDLYKRNLLRIISDVNDNGHPVVPTRNPQGEPLDLSLSVTRAVSPIHLEYLRNMGVEASMSVSIIRRGELWGLFACHNYTPRVLPYETRTAAELFGQLFSFVLDQKDSDMVRAEEAKAQQLHDQLLAQLAEGSSVAESFEAIIAAIDTLVPYDGVVGWMDGEFVSRGYTPTQAEFIELARFLNTTTASTIYHTESIPDVYQKGADFSDRSVGMLVLPVSRTPRDYIVLFRREILRTVNWAGNPEKPVELGPNGVRLTPRKSFEAWQETVRNHSSPWTRTELKLAESLRMTLLEVVLRMTDTVNKERARAQESQEFLIAELNHRVRNILNLIRSLITQSHVEGQSVADFTKVIGGRIEALARAHDQITEENWSPSSLREMIKTEGEGYLGNVPDRIEIKGDDVLLHPRAFTTVALVIHELMTNSAKYGALSKSGGSITICLDTKKHEVLGISWEEKGGPEITEPPKRRGFGTTVIERSIPYDLEGTVDLHFAPSGVSVRFEIPMTFVVEGNADIKGLSNKKIAPQSAGTLSGDVLVVEDNMIIALDAEDCLMQLGASKVHLSASVSKALNLIEKVAITFALLDMNLGEQTSEPVAEALREQGIPFVFATGYGDTSHLSGAFENVKTLKKPYSKEDIAAVLP